MDWGGGSDKGEDVKVGPYGRLIMLGWAAGVAALMLWCVIDFLRAAVH